ncbi:hypothetical protein [Halobellus limi]|uniref:Uncharacterized protein n=1 Tax=Halobellus limi TaxID=699433 RepID=A0A1H5ZGT2_9EURY|nr:hypothetical protein [Halobellus limi]QCC48107.1 hypothetical protein DV707_10785 [Halobellus limi]SEG35300.1 hypothetical protein SAMN04488133_1986 [Halobellus limi]
MSEIERAETTRRTYGIDGGIVPGRCAGYAYDGETYCPACAAEIDVTTADGDTYKMDHFPAYDDDGRTITDGRGFGVGVISGFDEFEYPGGSCGVCLRRLDTNILPEGTLII